MSKILYNFNNIEFFENTEENNEENTEGQSDVNNALDENSDNNDMSYTNQNDTDQESGEFPENEEVIKLRKEKLYDDNNDEVDEDPEYENEAENSEMDDLLLEDEQDEDDLSDEDIENLLNAQFDDDVDEIDTDKFILPKIDDTQRLDNPDFDEKLSDMGIDAIDDEDNLFTQGGRNGEMANDMIGQIQRDGDELADLILEVPIAIITMLIELVLKLIGAVLEGPITAVDNYLQPIRDALSKLYGILHPIVSLVNNVIALPFSIGNFTWSIICNTMKTFGLSVKCSTNYKSNNFILEFFEAITNINPFRFKDIFFNDEFRDGLFDGIRVIFRRIMEGFTLIIKTITLIVKIIEYIFELIKMVIKIIEEVTTKDNLRGFLITIIMIGCFYVSFYGLNKIFETVDKVKDKFSEI